MKVGIVGMPNAGKSSLFNALTQAGAEAANYPFTTIEPNVAVVAGRGRAPRRGRRRRSARRTSSATRSTSTTSRASSRARTTARASATASSRTSARPTRSSTSCAPTHDPNVIHPEGRVDPMADIETIETELIFADLEQAERRHARVVRDARGGERAAVAEEAWLRELIDALHAGRPARTVPPPEGRAARAARPRPADRQAGAVRRQRRRGRRRGPGRRSPRTPPPRARARSRSPAASRPSCAELDDEDAAEMRADLGVVGVGPAARRRRRVRAAATSSRSSPPARTSPRSPGTCGAA